MQLRSGTVVSNMSRASSPSNEGMNVRENNVHNTEPVMVPASQDVENNTTQPYTTIANTSRGAMWPIYGLPPGYTPPGVLPQVSNQLNGGTMSNIPQNHPLCQNWPLMANIPQIGVYPQPLGTHVPPINVGTMGNMSPTNPPTTTRQDIGPTFPTMSRNHATASATNNLDYIVVFRQQINESHHDLANMLTL